MHSLPFSGYHPFLLSTWLILTLIPECYLGLSVFAGFMQIVFSNSSACLFSTSLSSQGEWQALLCISLLAAGHSDHRSPLTATNEQHNSRHCLHLMFGLAASSFANFKYPHVALFPNSVFNEFYLATFLQSTCSQITCDHDFS